MKEPQEKAFYTVKELAKLLSFSERTIRDKINRGEIKSVRFGGKGPHRIPLAEVKRLLGEQKAIEDLPNVATQLKDELLFPAPETVPEALLVGDFGRPGPYSFPLRGDAFTVIWQDLGYNISKFRVYKESSGMPSGDIKINVAVSDYGDLELFCPVEDNSLFPKLLSSLSETGEQFTTWKQRGGQCLTMCRNIRQQIDTEAGNSTPQSAYEMAVRFLPGIFKPSGLPPSPLTDNFGSLVYRLCILYSRSSGQFGLPNRERYLTRPRGPFLGLYLGQTHLASVPNPPFPPPPPYTAWSQFLEGWADLHRDMIRKWGMSPAIIELLKLFEDLRRTEATIKQELDNIIHGK